MHDRGDYKHGWQLEREIEQGVYGHKGKFIYLLEYLCIEQGGYGHKGMFHLSTGIFGYRTGSLRTEKHVIFVYSINSSEKIKFMSPINICINIEYSCCFVLLTIRNLSGLDEKANFIMD